MKPPSTAGSARGETIGDRYVLDRRIGEGGMAEVFLARDERERGAPVVIKRCRAHLAYQPEFATLFLREARLASLIHHPNVVELTDTGDDNGLPYLVMEYLRGFNVRDIFVRAPKVDGVPQDVAAAIILGAARGLHAAHTAVDERGQPMRLVHRDVSPHNLFVTEEGAVKVLDFGIAKGVNDTTTTRAGHVKGKASYLAPEQLVPDTKVDFRTDLFTLGIVAWELFTGKRLFKRATEVDTINAIRNLEIENPRKLAPSLDEAYAATVQRLLARMPSARPASAQVVADELAAALSRRCGEVTGLDRRNAGTLATFVSSLHRVASITASGEVPSAAPPAPLDKVGRKRAFEDAWGLATGTAPAAPPALAAQSYEPDEKLGRKPPPLRKSAPPPRPASTNIVTPRPEENTHTVAPPVAESWQNDAVAEAAQAPSAPRDAAAPSEGMRIAGPTPIDLSGGYVTLDAAGLAEAASRAHAASGGAGSEAPRLAPKTPPPPPPPGAGSPSTVPLDARAPWLTTEPDERTLAAYLAIALVAGIGIAFALTSLVR